MLGLTRIVVFDDKPEDLKALVDAINGLGVACLGFQYTGNIGAMRIPTCPDARVVFFDLNMVSGALSTDFAQDYSAIASLLRRIKPKGPYLLIIWTHYSNQVGELRNFLDTRLTRVPKPFRVETLEKDTFIDEHGNIRDLDSLMQAIKEITERSPTFAALSDWEERVFSAAADTLSSVTMLGDQSKPSAEQQRDIPRLVAGMSKASVGEGNVVSNPFRAVNDALLPVLADHVATTWLQDGSNSLWQDAISEGGIDSTLAASEVAQLNSAFHIAQDIGSQRGAERGAVIPLWDVLSPDEFENCFGLDESAVAKKEYTCTNFQPNSPDFLWVLIQAQAACDFAQRQPGPLPYYLGIEVTDEKLTTKKPKPAAWTSPIFQISDSRRKLRVNARFHMSMTEEMAREKSPKYRLREQLLTELAHEIHTYGNRPGIISFR